MHCWTSHLAPGASPGYSEPRKQPAPLRGRLGGGMFVPREMTRSPLNGSPIRNRSRAETLQNKGFLLRLPQETGENSS